MTGEDAALAKIIEDTPDHIFEMGGGFDFTDKIAVALNDHWRKQNGACIVSRLELAWLLDGYARARLSQIGRDDASVQGRSGGFA